MFSVSPSIRIFLCVVPTDMRRQFDGLIAMVKHTFQADLFSGDYFVFFNRTCDRCKILYWDHDGAALWAKRLEKGRFQLPAFDGSSLQLQVDATTLALILSGVDLKSAKRRPRYNRVAALTPESVQVDHSQGV